MGERFYFPHSPWKPNPRYAPLNQRPSLPCSLVSSVNVGVDRSAALVGWVISGVACRLIRGLVCWLIRDVRRYTVYHASACLTDLRFRPVGRVLRVAVRHLAVDQVGGRGRHRIQRYEYVRLGLEVLQRIEPIGDETRL